MRRWAAAGPVILAAPRGIEPSERRALVYAVMGWQSFPAFANITPDLLEGVELNVMKVLVAMLFMYAVAFGVSMLMVHMMG
jgi:ABC-type proline/glycine betaine transport system substrate-binding protein